MENEQKIVNWRDVVIDPNQMSMAAILQFLNILNQRLSTIEDNMIIRTENGEHMSITQIYALQSQAQLKEDKKGE